ncbi:hypothetical protein RSAG8_05936, partial [Rhizoctonia solani AG-8 WAC10335]
MFNAKKEGHTLAQLAKAEAPLYAPSAMLQAQKGLVEGTLESYSALFYNVSSLPFCQEVTDVNFGKGVLIEEALAELYHPDLAGFLS